jgi:ribosomal-protein-alanine N-acetyltransferase
MVPAVDVELLTVNESGAVPAWPGPLPPVVAENCRATAALYQRVGYSPPWIGYLSLADGRIVGGGGFTAPPADDCVEIAYYTLPGMEGRGCATATARALIAVARKADPRVQIVAHTLPEPNASNALLKKIGFEFAGPMLHPEDGEIWQWRLPDRT